MIRALVIAISLVAIGTSAQSQNVIDWKKSQEWTIREPARPEDTAITIFSGGYPDQKMVAAIHMDGSVEFGEGFTADDAAREFWKHMGRSLPNKCEAPK